ncbi:uncharacterized protein LOC113776124 isoform X3 [Coffea eugenioides]|uniref:uncharacterized protein LOC113776124 isoform X3 n=1 Tax=Coffea eugenioides TaxID=49369 RepID=UPI000F6077A8|nr:uncharacterized protein LOC113776124 isoform X3 [Coffea eugenioides]
MLDYVDVLMWICSHQALACATALLEGKTGLSVDLNVTLKCGFYPLHYAAENLCCGLTDVFLKHGALTSLPCSVHGSRYSGKLPLSVALEAIGCHPFLRDWSPNKSIFKLIYIFCLPEMAEPLETLKLLALHTEELQVISSSNVHEGRLVQLVALLLVAREKLLAPAIDNSVDGSFIGQCILKELALLLDQEVKLMGTAHNEELNRCRQMKDAIRSMGLMLNVFDKAGGPIDRFRYFIALGNDIPPHIVVRNVICLLKDLGFALKTEDIDVSDISWQCGGTSMVTRLNLQESARLSMALDNILQPKSSWSEFNQNSVNGDGGQRQIQMNSPFPAGISVSSLKSFHTCLGFMPRPAPVPAPPRGTQKIIRGMQPGSRLCWATHWAFRALTIKRRIS